MASCPRWLGCLVTISSLVGVLYAQKEPLKLDSTSIVLDEIIVESSTLTDDFAHATKYLNGHSPGITESLDRIPGFFKVQSNNYPLSYRGQNGDRLRIEQNGMRRTGVLQQGYYGEDLNPEDIGQLSVVQGINKVTYGSGAGVGVIELKNKTPAKSKIYTGFRTGNENQIFGFSLAKPKWYLTTRRIVASDYLLPNGEKMMNSEFSSNNLSGGLNLNLSESKLLSMKHAYVNGEWERPQGFQNNPYELRLFKTNYGHLTTVELRSHASSRKVIRHRLSTHFQETEQIKNNYDGSLQQLNVVNIRTYQKRTLSYKSTLNFQPVGETFTFQTGWDFFGNRVIEYVEEDDFINDIFLSKEFEQERRDLQAGAFIYVSKTENNGFWRATLRTDLARSGNHEALHTFYALTGGVEREWMLPKDRTVLISLGRYFRYPSQLESSGIFYGGRGTFLGNSSIRPESSYQLEGTLSKKSRLFTYQVQTWVSWFEDRIVEVPTETQNSYTYENVGFSRTVGLEGSVIYVVTEPFTELPTSLSVSGTFIRGDELDKRSIFQSGEALFGIPPSRLNFFMLNSKTFSEQLRLKVSTRLTHMLPLERLPDGTINQIWAVVETPAYWLLSFSPELEWRSNGRIFSFQLEITNLTNTTYIPFGARITEMGRSYGFLLSYGF